MVSKVTSLCLFTFNELEGLKYTLKKIKKNFLVYVIDAGSTDGTIEYLKKRKIRFFIQKRKDYNDAYYLAASKAKSNNLIIFHPKKTFSISIINEIDKRLNKGYDFVFTSRMIKNAYNEEDINLIKPRKWFGILLSITTKIFFKKKNQKNLSDPLCGVRGFKINKFKNIRLKKSGVTADLEFFLKVFKYDLKFIEVPIKEKARLYGKTNFPAIRTGSKILSYLFNEVVRIPF